MSHRFLTSFQTLCKGILAADRPDGFRNRLRTAQTASRKTEPVEEFIQIDPARVEL